MSDHNKRGPYCAVDGDGYLWCEACLRETSLLCEAYLRETSSDHSVPAPPPVDNTAEDLARAVEDYGRNDDKIEMRWETVYAALRAYRAKHPRR